MKIITLSKLYMGSTFSGCSSTSKGLLQRGFEKLSVYNTIFIL